MCGDCRVPGTLCMWTDCAACFEGCAGSAGECTTCLGGSGEAAPVILIMAVIAVALFTVIGIFYSVLVATMVGQRIWQRHYHILAKRMLTKVSLLSCLLCPLSAGSPMVWLKCILGCSAYRMWVLCESPNSDEYGIILILKQMICSNCWELMHLVWSNCKTVATSKFLLFWFRFNSDLYSMYMISYHSLHLYLYAFPS